MPTSAAAFHNFSFELQLTFDNNNFPFVSIAEINLENMLCCCTSFSYSSAAELPLSWRVVWNTIDWNWIQLMRNFVATSWMAKCNIESYWARFFLCWTQISNPIKVIFFFNYKSWRFQSFQFKSRWMLHQEVSTYRESSIAIRKSLQIDLAFGFLWWRLANKLNVKILILML